MSSMPFDPGPMGRAERQYREAFERLKRGKPTRLPKGAKVSKNNVAREAGTVPSGLRRARFPVLVDEIQAWVADHGEDQSQQSPRQKTMARRAQSRGLRERIEELEAQRDDALGKLVSAEARIVELTIENERLRALTPQANIAPLRPAEQGRKPSLRKV